MTTKAELFRRVELADGRVRYRFTVDAGRDPATGKRTQVVKTCDTLREAKAERGRIVSERARGTFVRPRKINVGTYVTEYLEGATRDLRAATVRSYTDALSPVVARLGTVLLQDLTKSDVERLVTWMQTSGRKRGGQVGTGLGPRSIRLTLGRLVAMMETAQAEGLVVRNVAKLVKPPEYLPAERATWTREQVTKFLRAAAGHRLHAAFLTTMYGARRGEVLGLAWDGIGWGSFGDTCTGHGVRWCAPCYGVGDGYRLATITIDRSRVLVAGVVVEQPPKSRNGIRTLPLDVAVVVALRALQVAQARERLAAGDGYTNTGLVVVDEMGMPVHPEWYGDEFGRVLAKASLPRIVLHGARHTAGTLMEHAGVPISIISRWLGHYDGAFTQKTYVHAQHHEDMAVGAAALGQIYKIS